MRLYFKGDVRPFISGIRELSEELGIEAIFDGCPGDAVTISVVRGGAEDELRASVHGNEAEIVWGRRVHFYRALGLILEQLGAGATEFEKAEHMYFTMNGPMYDVSQGNAVINVRRVKRLLRTMALMGLDMLMLYCEDSYEVPSEPYFGYMRSRYTEADMRELDDYADALGIEMIPCIQTLAHLPDTLRWDGVYGDIKEDGECLLVGEERTYEFIRHLLEAASRPFRTKRIHIGMDEAWRLGLGAYLQKHGLTPKSEIMRIHLERVMGILRDLGLKPMMWSDMYFRAVLPDGGYYPPQGELPDALRTAVPEGMQIVYWDYYHDDQRYYEDFLGCHQAMGETVFAGGIWTWMGFGANYARTFDHSYPAVMACKKKGLREVFLTVWGDNGTECNIDATLPGLAFYAEHGYNEDLPLSDIARRFDFCTGAHWDDFMKLQSIDTIPSIGEHDHAQTNASKFLMWQDVLLGLFDRNIEGLPLNAHYEALAAEFSAADGRNGYYDGLMRFNYHVADVLALKCEIGLQLTAAYKARDTIRLRQLADRILPDLRDRAASLRKCHKQYWFRTYKAVGWDVMDLRYGSLLIRIESAIEQVKAWLAGDADALAELDEPRLLYNGRSGIPAYTNFYGQICSASRIAPNA